MNKILAYFNTISRNYMLEFLYTIHLPMDNKQLLNTINEEVEQQQITTVLDTFTHESEKRLPDEARNVIVETWDRKFVVTYRKAFRDYLLDYFFFILKILFIILLPIILIACILSYNPKIFEPVKNVYNSQVQTTNMNNQIYKMFWF